MSDYEIEAEPVFYKGTWFRSKLEAKWYAFLSQNERFPVYYEPCSFGDWTPDFMIDFTDKDECWVTYVEVKPYHHIKSFFNHRMFAKTPNWPRNDYDGAFGFGPNVHPKNISYKDGYPSCSTLGVCGSSPACFRLPHPCCLPYDGPSAEGYYDYCLWPKNKDMGWAKRGES